MKKLLGCALALFVSGCGSSTDFVVQNSAPNSASSTLSSLVTDPQGAAAQGVRVIAQERSSGRQFEGVTAPDGTILLSLPAGVYDVGLDREGDSSSATCFYGPVIVEGPVQRSFVLQSSGGLPAGRVFGTLFRTPGVAFANQKLVLRPGAVLGDITGIDWSAPATLTTDENGRFSADLASGHEYALDLELYDGADNLDEFIDISKRDKPCYVEFSTDESSVNNRFRCNESDLADSFPQRAISAQTITPVEVRPFSSCFIDTSKDLMVMEGASLPPLSGSSPQYLSDLVPSVPVDSNYDKLIGLMTTRGPVGDDGCQLLVDTDHAWYWGNYAVHVNPDRPSNFTFFDNTNDHYNLGIDNADNIWHRVSYRSSNPAIQKLQYSVK